MRFGARKCAIIFKKLEPVQLRLLRFQAHFPAASFPPGSPSKANLNLHFSPLLFSLTRQSVPRHNMHTFASQTGLREFRWRRFLKQRSSFYRMLRFQGFVHQKLSAHPRLSQTAANVLYRYPEAKQLRSMRGTNRSSPER